MGYRVVVNLNLCESNALCMGVAPDVFEVGDDDLLRVLDEHPGDDASRSSRRPFACARNKRSRSTRTDEHASFQTVGAAQGWRRLNR